MEKLDLSKFEEQEKPIDIKYYIIKYSRYWPLYALFIGLGLVIVFLFHRYTVERYEVKGSVMIQSNSSPEVRVLDRSNIFTNVDNLGNDILLFTSENLADAALQKLHFDVSYYASTNIKEIELYTNSPIRVEVDWSHPQVTGRRLLLEILSPEEFTLSGVEAKFLDFSWMDADEDIDADLTNKIFRFGEIVQTPRSKFVVNLVNPGRVGDEVAFMFQHPSQLSERFSKAVSVRPVYDYGSVLEVSLVTTVVEKGRDYVNALMDSFIEYDLIEKNRISENTLRFIDQQLFMVEDSLNSVESRMQDFKVRNKLLDVNAEFGGVLSNIQSLEANIQAIDFELAYYRSLQEYLAQKSEAYEEIVAPSLIGINDALLNGLIKNLVDLSLERRKLLSIVNDNHPDVLVLDQQVQRVRDNVFENINNLIKNTESRKKENFDKLRTYDRQFSNLPEAESNYSNIFREFKLRENLYTYLLEKRAEAGIAKASNVSDNSVVDYAKKGRLIFPTKSQNYAYAVGLGFFVPFGFLLLYHYLNNRIMDQIQLKSILKIPLLGTIGYSDKDTNLLVAEFPRALASESFRSIRSGLFYIASEKKCKNILVTSSIAGEGKTFISINIASAMALSGKRTCIVGIDLRKPKLAQYMKVSNKVGLSSFLIDKCSMEEIILPTEYDNLYVVPSGPVPPNPSELLLKDKMKGFMEKLQSEFEIIIMDSPPIGLVSETMDLLRFSDINLYIVRHDYTHKNHLLMINDLYASDQISNFYAIFNGVKSGGDVYDFAGYNYGYGYNYSYMKKSRYSGNYYEEENNYSPGWVSKLISKFKA
ncbi:MAG TPA: polysaccharide biosynthesis tyrosine autokinase [Cyclobacteriaceae bacterium]|nr:polysaccharide biosynthesis tyrosine autokinase [Cyclobacteriaceae bacterium]